MTDASRTCEWTNFRDAGLGDGPPEAPRTCTEIATHTTCDPWNGLVCEKHRCRCSKPLADPPTPRPPGRRELQECAEALWSLLDDIDTLSDSIKPERTPYYEAVMRISEKRLRYGTSDGYTVAIRKAAQ